MIEVEPEIDIREFHIFADGLDHPECCAFDSRGTLWVGGENGQVYRISKSGCAEEVVCVGGFNAGLAFSPDDRLFVCNANYGVLQFDPSGAYDVFANEVAGKPLIAPNFAVFDSAGNLYFTDSGDWMGRNGRLLRFDPQGLGTELLSGLGYANGLALSQDERVLFMVESDSNSVFRVELSEGGKRASSATLYAAKVGHVPDGLALDTDSNLYVACYASHELHRIDSFGQRTLFARDLNGMLLGGPTNLCFGGSDFNEIYVANLGRRTITRTRINRIGLRPINLRKS